MTEPRAEAVALTEVELIELQRLADAATAGPWRLDERVGVVAVYPGGVRGCLAGETFVHSVNGEWVGEPPHWEIEPAKVADAAFIAAARDAIPRLVAALLAYRGEPEPGRGTGLIAAERQRQIIEEGYGPDHDRGHADELAAAGASYATPAESRETHERVARDPVVSFFDEASDRASGYPGTPRLWPWHPAYWKPTPHDRVRELVKAGALIAAAIDSLQEAQP